MSLQETVSTVRAVPKGLTPWQPGQSGNPAGRPVSSRNKINEQFLQHFQKEWEESGPAALHECATKHPVEFMRAAISLLPKELHITEIPMEDVTDNELAEFIAAVRSSKARIVGAEVSPRTAATKRKAKS